MILLLDNYDSFTYNLYQMVCPFVDDVQVFRNDKISIHKITQLKPQGIIISPGPGRPEDAGICVSLVQELSGHIPILGVCLGHQAIVMAFGGYVISSKEIVHGKPAAVFHQHQALYHDLPMPFTAGRYHSLCVDETRFPDCLQIEATIEDGTIMGMKHKEHPTYGIQFHPESILTPEGGQLLANFCILAEKYKPC